MATAVQVGPHRFAPRRFVTGTRRAFSTGDYSLEDVMLWTIFLVLVVMWMLGVVSSYTLGGFIHVLLVLAIVALLVQLIQGRRVV
jgi:hypothetical protein